MRLPFPVILASGSPRRKKLLSKVVKDFQIEVSDVDEEALTVEDPWETAQQLAYAKAQAVADAMMRRQEPAAIVLGFDTVVTLLDGGSIVQLAKPKDVEDAVGMLKRLSGRQHAVITGVALIAPFSTMSGAVTSWVTFREVSDLEIRRYVATGEPMDKAGAYAIQGGAKPFVSRLEGDVETVIGLPTKVVRKMLRHVANQPSFKSK